MQMAFLTPLFHYLILLSQISCFIDRICLHLFLNKKIKIMEDNSLKRYFKNPFIENVSIEEKKRVKRIGIQDNIEVVSKDTGVIVDDINMGMYIREKYDAARFIKLLIDNIGVFFGFESVPAYKVAFYFVCVLEKNATSVYFNCDDCIDFINREAEKYYFKDSKISKASVYRALKELCEKKVIAKSRVNGVYFINPAIVFNGDRFAMMRIFEKENPVPDSNRMLEQSTKENNEKQDS